MLHFLTSMQIKSCHNIHVQSIFTIIFLLIYECKEFCMVIELEIKRRDKNKCILLCIGWTTNAGKDTRSCGCYQECFDKELMELNESLIMPNFPSFRINHVPAHPYVFAETSIPLF